MAPKSEYKIIPGDERDGAEEPFLPSLEHAETCQSCAAHRSRRLPWLRWIFYHVCIATVYMAVLGAVFGWYAPQRQYHQQSQHKSYDSDPHFYAPARKALQLEETVFQTTYEGNPYAGEPRPEHEQAWYDLLKDRNIRVSGEELDAMNQTSLELKEGGYIVQLGVFHQLHCVKWIRQWSHHEHYWPELNSVMLEERKRHIDHCLEMFRFHFMCHPNLSLGTYEWFGSHPTPILKHYSQCANWDALMDWNKDHTVELTDLNILANRPPTEAWEPSDLSIILGTNKGKGDEVEKFTEALIKAEPVLAEFLHVPGIDLSK